jgi:hypothetical protein
VDWDSGRRDLATLVLVRSWKQTRAAAAEAAQPVDPWRIRLERVRGTTGFDGLERISTQTLMDILEVPQRQRTAGSYRHLATLMSELGWTAVRVRDFTRGGYKEQVRGYVRGGHAAQGVARANSQGAPVAR